MTHIIILAQGEQRRLPDLRIPKQMLPLPACDNTPILKRTLLQLGVLSEPTARITIVAREIAIAKMTILDSSPPRDLLRGRPREVVTLPDPGNSSLKGISRYLSLRDGASISTDGVRIMHPEQTTIVLLGDVVYSWACLMEILHPLSTSGADVRFVGTSDLSTSRGELWGIAWNNLSDPDMRATLADALAKHPPYEQYQPGQLRRWLWAVAHSRLLANELAKHPPNDETGRFWSAMFQGHWPAMSLRHIYSVVDDYTRDIDLPAHVDALPQLSELAAADDRSMLSAIRNLETVGDA